MAPQRTNDFRTKILAILAVRHGRELGEQISKMRDAPAGGLPRSNLSAMLRRFEVGEVTDGQDLVVLEALHVGLAERMSQEIIGSRVEPRLAGYDEDGEIWSMTSVPIYTKRGEEAQSAYVRLEKFLEVRQRLLDRANAERLAMRLLR